MSNLSPDKLIDRHEAFLARQRVSRPLVGFWLGGYYPAEQFAGAVTAWRQGQELHPHDILLTRFAADYERLYEIHRLVPDDFFYVASAYWGIPWLEAILGCRVFTGKETTWAQSCLETSALVPPSSFNLNSNPWWQSLLDFTRELVTFSAARFPVCPPLLRGPGDAISAMLGPMKYAVGFIDAPGKMLAWLEFISTLRISIIQQLNAIIPPWHGAYVAGGYPSKVWSKRPVAYNQEDSVALLNPGLFTEFLLPCERRQCQSAKVNFIHLHSACLYPVDILLNESCYDVLEINVDHDGVASSLISLLPVLQKIQKAGRPLLLWGRFSQEDIRLFRSGLSPTGLSIQPIVDNIEQAHEFWQALCLKPWCQL